MLLTSLPGGDELAARPTGRPHRGAPPCAVRLIMGYRAAELAELVYYVVGRQPDGISAAELCDLLGLPPNAEVGVRHPARGRVFRALQKLKYAGRLTLERSRWRVIGGIDGCVG